MPGLEVLRQQWRTVTIEPVVAFNAIGLGIVIGTQIKTDLLYWKACRELSYEDAFCSNITHEGLRDDQAKLNVSNYVTEFQMYSGWMYSVPVVFFSVIAGALSDQFGRKPLILYPIIGMLISHVFSVVNYAFLQDLPIAFFYTDNIAGLFGGHAVYYLGTYSYGTNVTRPKERAHRLARIDGVEVLSSMLGTLLSPLIRDRLGFYGIYGIGSGFLALSVLYLIVVVDEPHQTQVPSGGPGQEKTFQQMLRLAVVTPIEGLKLLIVKKRSPGLRQLILLQVFLFTIYWTTIETTSLNYNFLRLIFNGFGGKEFAGFTIASQLANSFYLMIVIPLLNVTFDLHDSIILFVILLVESVGNALTAFTEKLWQFYASQMLAAVSLCKYSMVRSLLSKCIATDEVGKVYSVLAIMAALGPVVGSPLFRSVFNKTGETFPGAFYLMSGSMSLLASCGNMWLYANKRLLVTSESPTDSSCQENTSPSGTGLTAGQRNEDPQVG